MINDLDYIYSNIASLQEMEETSPELPLPISIHSAEGCYLIDDKGNKYLDMTSNKECQPLGYFNSYFENDIYVYNSELFSSSDAVRLEKELIKATGLNKAQFFSSFNSCYKHTNTIIKNHLDKIQKNKILVTSTFQNREKFLINDVETEYIPLNNSSILKSLFTKTVGAIIVEVIQITEELLIANSDYLKLAEELCNKHNALLVLDVSEISPLRFDRGLFNYDESIKPDVLLISRGITNGIPFGAVITSEKAENIVISIKDGTIIPAYKHALKFINNTNQEELRNIVKKNAAYIENSLNQLSERHISVGEVKSYGMFFTIYVDISAYELARECLKNGVIFEAMNPHTIKLSPPYTIGKEEIDKLVNSLDTALDKLALYDRLN